MFDKKLSEYVIDSFDGGVNFRDIKSELSKNELSDCLNMYYKGKQLKTRKGMWVKEAFSLSDTDCDIIPISAASYTDNSGYKMFLITKKDDFNYNISLLVVNAGFQHTLLSLGAFPLDRYSADISKVCCIGFSGKPTLKSGYYLLLSLCDNYDNIHDKFVYELSSDFSEFELLEASDIYKPLISINGKGNRYIELPSSKKTFPTTKYFEDYNLLSGGFRASFTTDGISTEFYLPTNNLSSNVGENIIVDYTSPVGKQYVLEIPYSEDASSIIEIDEIKYVFSVNRANGSVTILDENQQQIALPMSEVNRNNLVITAYKNLPTDILFKTTVVENFNSRIFLTGYEEQGNVVYFSRQNNPLYFPKSNFCYFGESGSNIVALKHHNDRLMVFKQHQIGVFSSISGSSVDDNYVLKGGLKNETVIEKASIKTLKTGIGCLYPDTIMSCANRLVFLGSDNRIYVITTSSNYTHRFYRISDKIESKLNEFDFNNAFATDYEGCYKLFVNNKCFLFDYNSSDFLSASSLSGNKNNKDKIAWYYFEYDFGAAQPITTINFAGRSLIVAKGIYSKVKDKIFLYDFDGKKDQKVLQTLNVADIPIKSSFSTAVSDLNKNGRKNIVGIEITVTNDNLAHTAKLKIEYLNENKKVEVSNVSLNDFYDEENIIKKTACIFGVRHFGVSLTRESAFAIKQIKYIYKK